MYFYNIAVGAPDGNTSTTLCHREKFSESQITEMIGDASIDILSKKEGDRGTHRFPRDFEWIYDDVIEWLIANRGFIAMTYAVHWSVYSFASLFDLEDHRYNEPSNLDPITIRLKTLGYSRKDDYMLAEQDVCNAMYNELRGYLFNSEYSAGILTTADMYVGEKLKAGEEENIMSVIGRLFFEVEGDKTNQANLGTYINLIWMAGRIEISEINSLSADFLRRDITNALSHPNIEVREAAIRALENWSSSDKKSRNVLLAMPVPKEEWLADYLAKIKADLQAK